MLKHFWKMIFLLLLGVLLLSAPNTGSASISLEFNPMSQSANLGSTASVDIWVTNLGSAKVELVDFYVNYDPSIIEFNSIAWGTHLGTLVPGVNAVPDYSPDFPGTVGVWAQYDGTSILDQDGSDFLLATMDFSTIAVGTSDLWFTDAFGNNANADDCFSGNGAQFHKG